MPDKPVVHGNDHRPGGFDPTPTGPWHLIGSSGEPAFLHGSNAMPTVGIPNPVPMRYRLSTGAPNILNRAGTSIVTYTDHQVEIQGDVTGLSPGDVVFILPIEYCHQFDVPYHTHDDLGNYVPCRLFSTGEFAWDVA